MGVAQDGGAEGKSKELESRTDGHVSDSQTQPLETNNNYQQFGEIACSQRHDVKLIRVGPILFLNKESKNIGLPNNIWIEKALPYEGKDGYGRKIETSINDGKRYCKGSCFNLLLLFNSDSCEACDYMENIRFRDGVTNTVTNGIVYIPRDKLK